MIPAHLHKYFWDVSPGELDLRRHKRFILERLLDLGDGAAARWVQRSFTPEDIKRVLAVSRRLSAKSVNYWRLVLAQR